MISVFSTFILLCLFILWPYNQTMVVYVEDAIFVEMLINIILVSLTICMTKLMSSKFRVVLSASFGTLCSILITFVGIKNSIIVFALKLLCGVVMVIILPLLLLIGGLVLNSIFDKEINIEKHKEIYRKGLF